MATTSKNTGEFYADRATRTELEDNSTVTRLERTNAPTPPTSTGPVIYGGTMPPPSSQDDFVRQTLSARGKSGKARKRSPFNLMLTMIVVAIAIVLYIGNVIAVEELLKEVTDEQAQLQQILNEQEMLKAQINRMSSLERIRKMAEDDLGLHNPKGPPRWIQVDENKVREIEQELSSQQSPAKKSNE